MANSADTQLGAIRQLPYNIQAEQMLLGAILINPELLHQVSEFLKVEYFFEVIHQKIYYAINAVTNKGLTASPITVKTVLDKQKTFAEVNSGDYLAQLTTLAIAVINPREYGQIIYDLAIKRDLISIGEEIVNTAYDPNVVNDAASQIEQAEQKLYNLASVGISNRGFSNLAKSVSNSLTLIDRAIKSSDHITGISTGLFDLDTKLSGFHDSDLVVIAGRPSMGKTAFAINLALNACRILKKKTDSNVLTPAVGFFSLEMSSEQLALRLLSMGTEIDSSALRTGMIKEESYNQLRQAATDLAELQLFIDDTPALSIGAIRTRARNLKRKHNLAILFIDYLQLIRGSGKHENRVLEISEITQGLKAIAKELNIPVIALSQLSRAVEQRDNKRPMLQDLRESGSIEQDADLVMFLYREEYYLARKEPNPNDAKYVEWLDELQKVSNITDIIIAKHRNGPIGNITVFYNTHFSQFKDLEKIKYTTN